jgi:pyruvate/2-oxoglutarate dehydrogenase complex dihydrolipoamide dehydrogenase (E3) component
METERYDAIVIGAGQGGKPLAIDLAKSGRRTAVVERKFVGGTCVNVGCTPTKTMVASGRVAYLARRGADYGVRAGEVSVDLSVVRRRKQSVVESFRDAGRRALEQTEGLDLLFGEARFVGERTLEVRMNDGSGVRRLAADAVFVNAGGRPSTLDVPGIGDVAPLDSSSIMELDELPEHLVVIGGSYIGLEFGQMFRRFGSRVTVVQRGPHLLGREDPDVADEIARILAEDGIEILLGTVPVRAERDGQGLALTVREPGGERRVSGSHLLVAAGRTPNTDALDPSAAGVETDARGFIRVNERLETTAPGVWAIGDVKGGPEFTHISYDDYRIVRENLIRGGRATTEGRFVPYTVFIDPQLGRVGMTETEAREKSPNVLVAKIPMTYVARAIEMGETRGFMKAVVDRETKRILGCAVLGVEGGEVMAMLQLAMMGGLAYTTLEDATFAHPTLAESLNTLFMQLED